MGFARTCSVALVGVEGVVVEVQADLEPGVAAFTLVGLPDKSLSESRDRVRAAVVNSGAEWPQKKLTVGLSPASVPKGGSGFDLAVAAAVLGAAERIDPRTIADLVLIGELGLDGRVRPVRGVLPAVLAAAEAGYRQVVVPEQTAGEASLVPGVSVLGVRTLRQLIAVLTDEPVPDEEAGEEGRPDAMLAGLLVPGAGIGTGLAAEPTEGPDLADVAGQHRARLALEVAAAGIGGGGYQNVSNSLTKREARASDPCQRLGSPFWVCSTHGTRGSRAGAGGTCCRRGRRLQEAEGQVRHGRPGRPRDRRASHRKVSVRDTRSARWVSLQRLRAEWLSLGFVAGQDKSGILCCPAAACCSQGRHLESHRPACPVSGCRLRSRNESGASEECPRIAGATVGRGLHSSSYCGTCRVKAVNWRQAIKGDRDLLSGFTCTPKPKKDSATGRSLHNPLPWERKVQSWFRDQSLASTARAAAADQQLWILPENGGIAAAYAHARCSLVSYSGPQRLIMALAVSIEHRRAGRKVADSTFEHALSTIRGSESVRPVLVVGKIDMRNEASQAMVTRAGMALIERVPGGGGSELGLWAIEID
ncbi:magnesium chelatase domain-containing protein [Streptomyces sp. PanSC19]|uniref:magnesium chelatase domain-containing protein n=1 Tax=Streptomyces sp. PanSC19 TaxID=1520455 RepID=UPI0021A6BBDF|nr:magnesium chelatase domain-containing protein [Streptomyces sp. PanSC19]